jgi:hypothetical protein
MNKSAELKRNGIEALQDVVNCRVPKAENP